MANCTNNFECAPYDTNRLCYAGIETVETDANGCGCVSVDILLILKYIYLCFSCAISFKLSGFLWFPLI